MITQLEKYLNQQPFIDVKTKPILNRKVQSSRSPSRPSLKRSDLLLKLTFNLSKGHYNFVSEMLKSKLERQKLNFEIDVNETVKNENLQFETNNLNKKFLFGKTPLILCNYIKENEWAISLTRLLIQTGASVAFRDQINGCTALHYACAMLKIELIEYLLRNTNFNLDNLRDHNGNTPLFYLISSYATYLTNNKNEIKVCDKNIFKIFNIFFNYLRHYNLKINAQNRFGLTLHALWDYFVTSSKTIETSEIFKYIGQVLKEENPNLKEASSWKNQTARLHKTVSFVDIKNETDSEYYSLSTSRTNIEFFIKRHLLIDVKNPKLIPHSEKIDNYLMFIYLNKVTPNEIPVNFSFIRDKSGLDKNTEIYRKNINIPINIDHGLINTSTSIKENYKRMASVTWRDRFNQLYNSLEVKNSESYRKSAKPIENKIENVLNHPQHHHSSAHLGHNEEHSLPQLSHRHETNSALNTHSNKKHKSHSNLRK